MAKQLQKDGLGRGWNVNCNGKDTTHSLSWNPSHNVVSSFAFFVLLTDFVRLTEFTVLY